MGTASDPVLGRHPRRHPCPLFLLDVREPAPVFRGTDTPGIARYRDCCRGSRLSALRRPMPELKIVENATCTFCGCVCDDMELTVEGDKITKAKNACVLGKAWFLNHHVEDRPVATIQGQPVGLDEAVEKAAQILAGARYPIVYGLSDTTCEAQRVAVAIADRIGGCVDTTTSVCHGPSGMAFQGVGEVTCSLGEVKNRADLVIFWGSNPAESHPRHWGRYSTMPKGLFV